MAAPPPSFPPTLYPPPVPEGWRADWSAEFNTWYYFNLGTQTSQWVNPLEQSQPPLAPPTYAPGPQTPPGPEQYPPAVQADSNGPQQDTPPADGDRGLGKIVGGGILGVLTGALISHEIDEHKTNKSKLNFWSNGNSASQSGGVGGLLGGLGNRFSNNSSNQSPPSAAGAVSGGAASGLFGGMASHLPFNTSNSPPLHIHCAVYSDLDVTQQVRRMVTPQQSLEINTDGIWTTFGDPWPDNRKQFSIIYSYGQRPWELVATADRDGILSILPHQPLDKERMEFLATDPRARVLAIVWGMGNGLERGKGRIEKLREVETSGEFQATNDWFGFDGMCGPAKTAVVYYRAGNGGVAFSTSREGMTCRMPWNPLARWT